MISTNLDTVINSIADRFQALAGDQLIRTVVTTMNAVVHDRIHEQGLAADGGKISSTGYSNNYLKQRAKFNRQGNDVILVLTGQMQTDFGVNATDSGYGLGYKNIENYNKAYWCEATYDKKIFALTSQERTQTINAAIEVTNTILNAIP